MAHDKNEIFASNDGNWVESGPNTERTSNVWESFPCTDSSNISRNISKNTFNNDFNAETVLFQQFLTLI